MRKTLTAFFLLVAATAVLSAGQEEIFDKTFSMEGVTRISIENVNGKVEAFAWDKPSFKVRAVKTASGSRADETLRLTEIRVRKIGDEMHVETLNPNRHKLFGILDFGGSNARVDYEVYLPAGAEARLQTCNGHVAASGFGAAVSADAVNGSIELKERPRAGEGDHRQRLAPDRVQGSAPQDPARDGERVRRSRLRPRVLHPLRPRDRSTAASKGTSSSPSKASTARRKRAARMFRARARGLRAAAMTCVACASSSSAAASSSASSPRSRLGRMIIVGASAGSCPTGQLSSVASLSK